MIFEPELETLPREQLRALQLERLRSLVAYVNERVPLYRERLADVDSSDIASVADLQRLPFTRKDDLRDTYPFGMFAVPRGQLSRIHASSGTTGKLTVVGYTAADLDLFARVNARSLAMAIRSSTAMLSGEPVIWYTRRGSAIWYSQSPALEMEYPARSSQ